MSELIDDKAIEILRHALGIEKRRARKRWGFRNYYVCGPGHDGYERCRALVDGGFMRAMSSPLHDDTVFVATREGMILAGLFADEADRLVKESASSRKDGGA